MTRASPLVLVAILLFVPSAAAVGPFGAAGEPIMGEYEVPVEGGLLPLLSGSGAPEPTIGIPWNTDHVFYHAGAVTVRGSFDGADNATWADVTPPYQIPANLDPMLHADPDTGRIWAGGLHGACSIMMISDDNGETWTPAGNMCSGEDFDHQSIGSGPNLLPAGDPAHPHAAYYCAQSGTISCATSVDGGKAWGPFQPILGDCGGFHGHIRASRATGFVAVPVPDCGNGHGFIGTADGGLTWNSYVVPGSPQWTNGFDPSLQFSRPSGWLYYGQASEHGIHIALTKDEGQSWERLAGGEQWLDVGQFHDPPVVAGTFADVQVGDDDRVAYSFLGLEQLPGTSIDLYRSNQIYQCDDNQNELIWHYYLATSYDAGQNWTVTKLTNDPVQVGGIFDSVVESQSGACRNLLDFNDMDIDSTGRVHIGWADGCVDACAETRDVNAEGARAQAPRLFRQVGGLGLFAAFDNETAGGATEPVTSDGGAEDDDGESNGTPGAGTMGPVLALLALAGIVRRRCGHMR